MDGRKLSIHRGSSACFANCFAFSAVQYLVLLLPGEKLLTAECAEGRKVWREILLNEGPEETTNRYEYFARKVCKHMRAVSNSEKRLPSCSIK